MLDPARRLVLRIFRVPPEPAIPAGARVLRVFRASPNYFRYRLALWALTQTGLFLALAAAIVAMEFAMAESGPGAPVALLRVVEGLVVAGYLVQIPVSFAVMRLGFEMRWYILMDRSLRIREGIVSVQEKTMTFANIQQISIERNPLQRVLGIADVHVRTAGGGGHDDGHPWEGMHEAFFRGVDNAEEIRTAIRERVRLHRGAGLGDPDDRHDPVLGARDLDGAAAVTLPVGAGVKPGVGGSSTISTVPAGESTADLLAAARELRDEVRAWRSARQPLPPASPDAPSS